MPQLQAFLLVMIVDTPQDIHSDFHASRGSGWHGPEKKKQTLSTQTGLSKGTTYQSGISKGMVFSP